MYVKLLEAAGFLPRARLSLAQRSELATLRKKLNRGAYAKGF
jgi:hypothetical protein